jgi:DinB superfamily
VTDLRYPIATTAAQRQVLIESIAAAPRQLRAVVQGLTPMQLDTPYRPDGWTAPQVAHHVADAHLNGYIRFRWALTEADSLIKAYDERAWALLPDASAADPEVSLALLGALHARWVILLPAMTSEQFNLTLRRPENEPMKMARSASHGLHHQFAAVHGLVMIIHH